MNFGIGSWQNARLSKSFQFGDGARAYVRALTLGVTATTVTIAFLVLATNHQPVAQLVALLFMENALALFE